MSDMEAADKRARQLDAIATILIVAMLGVVGMLLYYLSSSGIELPAEALLSSQTLRILLGGFVLLVVLYLADQRRRLRIEVRRAVAETEEARKELAATCEWLRFSHEAASRLGKEGVEAGLKSVLREAIDLFDADASAVLGEEEEYSFIAEGAPRAEAQRALTHVALVAAGHGSPLHIQSLGTENGQAIAVPLRVAGDLRFVLCSWRREGAFEAEQLDSLGLMGRMVELAIEREESLKEAQTQLEGTLRVLQYLVADKRPDYSRHVVQVAELASAVGQRMGLPPSVRKDLGLAGLVHDVGMLGLPGDIGDASQPLSAEDALLVREHPRIGSEIAKAANFDERVQGAVIGHHERADGSGYPLGLTGDQIPVEARILAVCEVFDSMAHRAYHGADMTQDETVAELTGNAGSLYDRSVVTALCQVLAEPVEDTGVIESVDIAPESEIVSQSVYGHSERHLSSAPHRGSWSSRS
jgi:hypothetical protein